MGSRSRVAAYDCDGSPNAPEHTEDTEGKILARRGYAASSEFIRTCLLSDAPDTDAYIFKGSVLQEAALTVVHTYRIIKPCVSDERLERINQHLEKEREEAQRAQEEAHRAQEEFHRMVEERKLNPCG